MIDPFAPARRSYAPELSGLRGLALLIVVVGHFVQRIDRFKPPTLDSDWALRLLIDFFASPAAGVYLFFSVSGYLIAQSLGSMRHVSCMEVGCFYLRRIFRIAPPYAIVLVLTWLVLTLCAWEPPGTHLYRVKPDSLLDSLLASLFFMHGVIYGTYPRLFPPGWTLEVEVQFYILAPFLCLGFRSLSARLGLGFASAAASAGAGVLALISVRSGIDQLQPTILVYMPLFLLGVIAYEVRQGGWAPSSRLTPGLGWIALVSFVTLQPWVSGLGVEIATRMALIAVMFSAIAARRGSFFSFCTTCFLRGLGTISYSVYLIHLQTIHSASLLIVGYMSNPSSFAYVFVNLAVSFVLIYAGSMLFYRHIEYPMLGFSGRLSEYNRIVFQPTIRSIK